MEPVTADFEKELAALRDKLEEAEDVRRAITRGEVDAYAARSFTRAVAAQNSGFLAGEIAPVAATPFDFTSPKPIGQDIRNMAYEQIAFGRGSTGYAAFNRAGSALTRTFQTSLPAGDYCDVQSGKGVTVDGSGRFTATLGAGTTQG